MFSFPLMNGVGSLGRAVEGCLDKVQLFSETALSLFLMPVACPSSLTASHTRENLQVTC